MNYPLNVVKKRERGGFGGGVQFIVRMRVDCFRREMETSHPIRMPTPP